MYNISIACILFCITIVLTMMGLNTSMHESFESLTQYHDTVNNPHLYLIDYKLPLPKNPNLDTFQFQGKQYNRTDMSTILQPHNVIDDIIKAPGSHLYAQQNLVNLSDIPDFIATKLRQTDNTYVQNTLLKKPTVLSNFSLRLRRP